MKVICIVTGLLLAVGTAFAEEAAKAPQPAAPAEPPVVKIEVDLSSSGGTVKRPMFVPNAARKLFKRFQAQADGLCPLTLHRCTGKPGKDIAWYVGCNSRKNLLLVMTDNPTDEDRKIDFKIKNEQPLTPTYRRVYSLDRGKTWQSIAYEPPHSSISGCPQIMPEPHLLEMPKHSLQVIFIRMYKK